MVTYDPFDVVSVPFPFTDGPTQKRRPALILSSTQVFGRVIDHSVLAMITSAKNQPWPLDVALVDLNTAGLSSASVVRMKLFTLDHRFIVKKIGTLSQRDRRRVTAALTQLLPKQRP